VATLGPTSRTTPGTKAQFFALVLGRTLRQRQAAPGAPGLGLGSPTSEWLTLHQATIPLRGAEWLALWGTEGGDTRGQDRPDRAEMSLLGKKDMIRAPVRGRPG
jgi:hypothetical protein